MSGAALSKANGASVIGEEEIVLLPTVTDVYRRLQAAPECSIPAEARVVDEDEVVSLLGVPLLWPRYGRVHNRLHTFLVFFLLRLLWLLLLQLLRASEACAAPHTSASRSYAVHGHGAEPLTAAPFQPAPLPLPLLHHLILRDWWHASNGARAHVCAGRAAFAAPTTLQPRGLSPLARARSAAD